MELSNKETNGESNAGVLPPLGMEKRQAENRGEGVVQQNLAGGEMWEEGARQASQVLPWVTE